MRRASPDARCWPAPFAQAAMWRSVAHQCNAPSSLPIPNSNFSSICPLSPRNKGLRIALGRRISHVSLRGSILVFRVAGVPVRRRPEHRTSDVLRCTVAPASLRISAANLAGNGRVLNRAAALRGRCPQLPRMHAGWGGLVGIGYFLFITFLSFDQIRAPSTVSSAGSSALRLPALLFEHFI